MLKTIRRARHVLEILEELLENEPLLVDPLEEDPLRVIRPKHMNQIRRRRDAMADREARADVSTLLAAIERQAAKASAVTVGLETALAESRRREGADAYDVLWSAIQTSLRTIRLAS